MMSEEELITERLILVALMKGFSEQSTFLTGHLKHGLKHDLKIIVNRVDQFVAGIEKNYNESQKEYLASVTDIYHNINLEIRKEKNKEFKS